MNICIIGDGLTSLSLAKNLVNKKINVHIYKEKKFFDFNSNRTIGISKNNFEFFKKKIQSFSKKLFWEINKIDIYSEKSENNKILNFKENKNNLFYMIKNDLLYQSLKSQLIKSIFFKETEIKNKNFYLKLLNNKKYDLIINCDSNNLFSKKFFFKKINKDYLNLAYTTILNHKIIDNHTATQIFTKFGPIAFLPISNKQTSVVYSVDISKCHYKNQEILDLINQYNPKFEIQRIQKISKFKLESSNLRNYYHKNILAFGDCLHKIHPLAGQGFNMTIRDIEAFSNIIQDKIDLGLQLDQNVLEEFENKTKHKNFIFSNSIDFIYEFFNFNKKNKSRNLNNLLRYIGENKKLNNMLIKYANFGPNI